MKKGPESKKLMETVVFLEKTSKKNKARIWRVIAEKINGPKRLHVSLNLGRIGRLTNANDKIVVVGKILGSGKLGHAVEIGCITASQSAKKKVKEAGGKITTLREIAEKNPNGSGVRIIQ